MFGHVEGIQVDVRWRGVEGLQGNVIGVLTDDPIETRTNVDSGTNTEI